MHFHTICGTPRSGSTLLCNILNQNPRFYASSTSCVAQSVRALSSLWSECPEVKSALISDRQATEIRLVRAARAMVEAWYADRSTSVIFDKGRLWNNQPMVLSQLFPYAHMFVCVRDPRDIFASIEKQHANNPMLDDASSPVDLTMRGRASGMFQPDGMIGRAIVGVEDLMRRQLEFVHFIQFETLVNNPQLVLDGIYSVIGEERFSHDLANVENTSEDVDGIYLNKFPHDGSGEVKAPVGSWRDHVSGDVADEIMKRFPMFSQSDLVSGAIASPHQ